MSGVVIKGSSQNDIVVTGNDVRTAGWAVECQAAVSGLVVSGNNVLGDLFQADAAANGLVASNVARGGATLASVGLYFDGAVTLGIKANTIIQPQGHGIHLNADTTTGPIGVEIADNTVARAGGGGSFTLDDIFIEQADETFIHGNRLTAGILTRYGLNIAAGNCNRAVGNDLGDPADYGTDALNDGGTNTQLFWPADPVYGDNFTTCPPGS